MIGSLGVPELLFILVLALLVFGPRKLPEIGRTLGRAMGEFRRATSDLKRTLDVELSSEEASKPSPPAATPTPVAPKETPTPVAPKEIVAASMSETEDSAAGAAGSEPEPPNTTETKATAD